MHVCRAKTLTAVTSRQLSTHPSQAPGWRNGVPELSLQRSHLPRASLWAVQSDGDRNMPEARNTRRSRSSANSGRPSLSRPAFRRRQDRRSCADAMTAARDCAQPCAAVRAAMPPPASNAARGPENAPSRRAFMGSAAVAAMSTVLPARAAAPTVEVLRIDPTPQFELSPHLAMQFMEPLGTTDGSVEAPTVRAAGRDRAHDRVRQGHACGRPCPPADRLGRQRLGAGDDQAGRRARAVRGLPPPVSTP
jgi:hypothetical protein